MIDLFFFIIGIIGLIVSVIYTIYDCKKCSECLPVDIMIIILFLFIIIIALGNGEQCIKCGNDYAKYKVCCPQCGSHELKKIKTKEEINIDSVDVNCNEVNIHKNEKKHACDEDTKQWICECGQINTGNYCQNCGKEK